MTDVFHLFNSDLTFSASGDLLTAAGRAETTQRLLRRLLTNARDYLWQPGYGAGLPGYIGAPLDTGPLSALVKAQMYLEAGVAHDPEPQVTLTPIPNGVSARIVYTGVEGGDPVLLNFDITP